MKKLNYIENVPREGTGLNDEEAFRAIFERYYPQLCLYAGRFIDDPAVREDIVQDLFFSIWSRHDTIVFSTSVKSYLMTAVKNRCLNHIRKNSRSRRWPGAIEGIKPLYEEGAEQLYSLKELQTLLEETLSKLPPEWRMAFEMSRLEDNSPAEIARKMGISVRSVERYRNRATEILTRELKGFLPMLILLSHSGG